MRNNGKLEFLEHQLAEAHSMFECLNYLETIAKDAGLDLCSHLIELSAEAAQEARELASNSIKELKNSEFKPLNTERPKLMLVK